MYGWCLKIASHSGFPSLPSAWVGPDVVDHVLKCGRTLFANGVRFHILVEHLIGIEFRAVGWQEDQPDLGRVSVDPLSCLPGAVDRMSIQQVSLGLSNA